MGRGSANPLKNFHRNDFIDDEVIDISGIYEQTRILD
jgi:hypothetical protein